MRIRILLYPQITPLTNKNNMAPNEYAGSFGFGTVQNTEMLVVSAR